jgi:hypothetical protein
MYSPKIENMSEEEARKVLEELKGDGDEDVARNLLLNVFDSYEDLQISQLQKLLKSKQSEEGAKDLRDTNANFTGKMALFVPEYDAATGTWSKEHKLKLKIEKPPLSA